MLAGEIRLTMTIHGRIDLSRLLPETMNSGGRPTKITTFLLDMLESYTLQQGPTFLSIRESTLHTAVFNSNFSSIIRAPTPTATLSPMEPVICLKSEWRHTMDLSSRPPWSSMTWISSGTIQRSILQKATKKVRKEPLLRCLDGPMMILHKNARCWERQDT